MYHLNCLVHIQSGQCKRIIDQKLIRDTNDNIELSKELKKAIN